LAGQLPKEGLPFAARAGQFFFQKDAGQAALVSPDSTAAFAEAEYRPYLVSRALEVMQGDFQRTTWKACWEYVVAKKKGPASFKMIQVPFSSSTDRQFADAIAEAVVPMKEFNRDLGDRLGDLKGAR
jgi:hypothetical protein